MDHILSKTLEHCLRERLTITWTMGFFCQRRGGYQVHTLWGQGPATPPRAKQLSDGCPGLRSARTLIPGHSEGNLGSKTSRKEQHKSVKAYFWCVLSCSRMPRRKDKAAALGSGTWAPNSRGSPDTGGLLMLSHLLRKSHQT